MAITQKFDNPDQICFFTIFHTESGNLVSVCNWCVGLFCENAVSPKTFPRIL